MTIAQAVKELKKKKNKGRRISSHKAKMYSQNRSNLLYWIFEDTENVEFAMDTLKTMILAKDWTLDEQMDK